MFCGCYGALNCIGGFGLDDEMEGRDCLITFQSSPNSWLSNSGHHLPPDSQLDRAKWTNPLKAYPWSELFTAASYYVSGSFYYSAYSSNLTQLTHIRLALEHSV